MIIGMYLASGLVAVAIAVLGWWYWAGVRSQRIRDRFQARYHHCNTTTALLPATLTDSPAAAGGSTPPTHASPLGNQRPHHKSVVANGNTGNGVVTANGAVGRSVPAGDAGALRTTTTTHHHHKQGTPRSPALASTTPGRAWDASS